MINTRPTPRRGFTLVELLVAMAVIVTLASIAVIVVPDAMQSDRTTDAAGSVRQWLSLAKARAARDQEPRGVRFLVGIDPNNPAKASPLWVTELQYLEARTILPLDQSKALFGSVTLTFSCIYDSTTPGGMVFTPPPFTVNSSPQCQIQNLAPADAALIVPGCLLTIAQLGTTHRILYVAGTSAAANGSVTATVVLDSFPQAQLGAAGPTNLATQANTLVPIFKTSLFGISAPPQPLVGEPTLQLPKNICVDLQASASGASSLSGVTADLDIMFLPSGQVSPTMVSVGGNNFLPVGASNQIFLWVRDYTKTPVALNVLSPGPPPVYDMTPFLKGGEQQIVSIKTKSGALGSFPVMWPQSNGTYPPGSSPYTLAQQGATSP